MKCPNCGRRVRWSRLRCYACHTKLIPWYVVATMLVLAAFVGVIVLLDRMA
ncbi:MAG TPA: hypothetical protein VMM84_14745 [Pyrinomonadaceae bacterium]|nr:hypothetical protein [Pyrinomonadaceae bacterium]